MSNYYNKDIECIDRLELKKLQLERLIKQVHMVYENVPYYKKKLDDKHIKPDDIKTLNDLSKLPFITKDDLRDTYPFSMFAKPLSECVRIHSTSGTTGKRVIVGYTKNDLDMWGECCARSIIAFGGNENDIVQIAYGYGLFTGGAGIDNGCIKVGTLTIPMSSGNTERQIQFMQDLGTTILCCTPSYASYLAEKIENLGVKDKIKLRIGIFGAEAWSDNMRKDLEKRLNIKAYNIYGLTELSGPGVAFECSEQNGMHINEDNFIVEIIDPDTLEPLPIGSKGELVITSITKEAFPIIRYRTKDICILDDTPCKCGRTHIKMSRPMGRTDDMLIIKGVNVFPSQIESVLFELGYSTNYQIIVDRVNNTDVMEVQVELSNELFDGTLSKITDMEKKLLANMKAMLGIDIKIRFVAKDSIERSEGKAIRVIDKRKI